MTDRVADGDAALRGGTDLEASAAPSLGYRKVELVCPQCGYRSSAYESEAASTACRSCRMRWAESVPRMIRLFRT